MDTDCGCDIVPTLIDGLVFPVHHDIPDDDAGHHPTTGCPCHPAIYRGPPVVVIHFDQDEENPPA